MDELCPFIFTHTGRISEQHSENEEAEQIDIWVYAAGCSLASSLVWGGRMWQHPVLHKEVCSKQKGEIQGEKKGWED